MGAHQTDQPIVLASLWCVFGKLKLIRANLISNMIKQLQNKKNYAEFVMVHKAGYWFNIRIAFLRLILAKIEIICKQPAISKWDGAEGGKRASCGLRVHMVFWVCQPIKTRKQQNYFSQLFSRLVCYFRGRWTALDYVLHLVGKQTTGMIPHKAKKTLVLKNTNISYD